MPLGLSFNQYGFYPYVSFWSPSLSRGLAISQLVGLMACCVPIRISSLGKPLTIGMKHRADRLLLRIYFAPYGRTNHMIVNMHFVYVSTHYKSVFPFGEPHSQFTSHAVCFFGRNFAGEKRLPHMISNHIIFPTHSACFLDVKPFHECKFFFRKPAAALIACYKLTFVRLFGIFHIIYTVPQSLSKGSIASHV